MAKLALVSIVKAVHLCEHDPGGNEGERHNGGTRPLPAEDERKGDRSGRNNVGEREHAPEHRVAPLAFEQRMVALRLRLLNVSHALARHRRRLWVHLSVLSHSAPVLSAAVASISLHYQCRFVWKLGLSEAVRTAASVG